MEEVNNKRVSKMKRVFYNNPKVEGMHRFFAVYFSNFEMYYDCK